jgi:hypothetical protein
MPTDQRQTANALNRFNTLPDPDDTDAVVELSLKPRKGCQKAMADPPIRGRRGVNVSLACADDALSQILFARHFGCLPLECFRQFFENFSGGRKKVFAPFQSLERNHCDGWQLRLCEETISAQSFRHFLPTFSHFQSPDV